MSFCSESYKSHWLGTQFPIHELLTWQAQDFLISLCLFVCLFQLWAITSQILQPFPGSFCKQVTTLGAHWPIIRISEAMNLGSAVSAGTSRTFGKKIMPGQTQNCNEWPRESREQRGDVCRAMSMMSRWVGINVWVGSLCTLSCLLVY